MDQVTKLKRKGARRWFIEQCGVGMGAFALNHLLASARLRCDSRGRQPARAKEAAFRAEGQERHLPLYGGRAEPSGDVRLQTATGQIRRHAASARIAEGYRAAFINPNSQLLGPKFKFAKHGQCGAELSELIPAYGGHRR